MRPQIGQAAEYYRCRIVEIVEDRPDPLDWRDDVLYREPPPPRVKSAARYTIQVISLDTSDTHDLKAYASEATALKKQTLIEEDLRDMTRSEFAAKYRLPWDATTEGSA